MRLRRVVSTLFLLQILAEYYLGIELDEESLSNPLIRESEAFQGDNGSNHLHQRLLLEPTIKALDLAPEAWKSMIALEEEYVELNEKIKKDAVLKAKPGMLSYADTICSQTGYSSVYSPRYKEGVHQLNSLSADKGQSKAGDSTNAVALQRVIDADLSIKSHNFSKNWCLEVVHDNDLQVLQLSYERLRWIVRS
ncbi:hypothetical protein GOP47_0003935 [Adiantum capillus-veneris]|uniref:Uncharacterized protein n=1 Tax=Adiantum capillus-veneris TaxID=13818 RepID=A0A9D4ZP18_ADICA|nr:hypothetical protein GOP47_0003935 [Adiantum capillus-veneris]